MARFRERIADLVRITFRRPPKERVRVRVGPPKEPVLSSGAALPLPEPEIRDVDALGSNDERAAG
jgi:hypothetical protein